MMTDKERIKGLEEAVLILKQCVLSLASEFQEISGGRLYKSARAYNEALRINIEERQ